MKLVNMNRLIFAILLFVNLQCAQAQVTQIIPDLRTTIKTDFVELNKLLHPVINEFSHDCLVFLESNDDQKNYPTSYGMAIGDLKADPKIFLLELDKTGLRKKPFKFESPKLLTMFSEYIRKMDLTDSVPDGIPVGKYVYLDPEQYYKQWTYLSYINKDFWKVYFKYDNAKVEILRYGPLEHHPKTWISKLFELCFLVSIGCVY